MDASVVDFLIGYAIIIAITVLGQMHGVGLGWLSPVTWPMRSAGLLVEYVAWTIGLGAAVTSLFAHAAYRAAARFRCNLRTATGRLGPAR